MKKKMWLIALVLGISFIVLAPTIYAASIIKYESFSFGNAKYKILVDGQTFKIPEKVKYDNGYELDLSSYIKRIENQNISNITYNNGSVTFNGGLFNASVSDEYAVFFNNVGSVNTKLTETLVKNGFLKFQYLPSRQRAKRTVENELENPDLTDQEIKDNKFRLDTYTEDIANLNKIEVDGASKQVLASLPYLGENANIKDELKYEGNDLTAITSNISLNYYTYSMIFRDLRLFSIKYSIDGKDYVAVPSFDKDTYTYTIKLPQTVADNATITTQSEGYMQRLINKTSLAGIESGLGDIVLSKIGDVSDAYELLREKISNVDSSNIFEIAQAVLETVDEYFGGLENHKDRLNYYYSEDYEESKDNKISNLKGKGAAMCVERAALSQNLLQLLGIRSFFKTSGIVKNGSNEAHSYNLIEYEGKYYIFDSTMPNMINNAPNPLIAEIDKESFDLITSPLAKTGISISTSHYNPYFSKNYEVTYDAAREKKIEVPALGNDAKQL